ncbi:MAG: hypothetical protein K8I04_11520 [Gammaproteobacteria bacterium]|nr:hypothetical protein [Gammaproteobacteria bacterium]
MDTEEIEKVKSAAEQGDYALLACVLRGHAYGVSVLDGAIANLAADILTKHSRKGKGRPKGRPGAAILRDMEAIKLFTKLRAEGETYEVAIEKAATSCHLSAKGFEHLISTSSKVTR